jgi:RNA-binding protein PNO1
MELDQVDLEERPIFAPAKDVETGMRTEMRQIRVPPHRFSPLKNEWPRIFPPVVEHLKLQIRMNAKRKVIEIRTSRHTSDPGAIQKAEDFLRAFVLGFDTDDAIA